MSDSEAFGEYAGCLYEAPTVEGQDRDWRHDPISGTDYPFDLTTKEILGMKLEGVPIRIEHALDGFPSGDEVGRVRESTTDPASGYTAVKFALHDTVAGRTVSRLINGGTLGSLSLGHMYDTATGNVTPNEVSVCFNGARPGSQLYKETQMYDRFKNSVQSRMAAVQESLNIPAADQAAELTDTALHAGQQAAAPASRKRNADEMTETDQGGASMPKRRDLADMFETMATMPGMDENLITDLMTSVAEIVGERKSSSAINSEQKARIDELQKQVASNTQKNKSEAENIVATMNALLAEFAPGSGAKPLRCGPDGDTDLRQVAMHVPILASALNASKHASAIASVKMDTLASLRSTLASDIRKALSPFPDDAPSRALEHRHAPAMHYEQQAPIAVNASRRGHEVQEAQPEAVSKHERFSGMRLTPGQRQALSGFGRFGEGSDSKLTADMMPTNFKGGPKGF